MASSTVVGRMARVWIVFGCFVTPLWALGDIYVKMSSGSDATGTGSSTNPYKTIWKALQVASGGDVIRVKGGTASADYYTKVNGETFPLPLKHNVDIIGDETDTAAWPRVGGDIANSTVKGVFECNANSTNGDIQFAMIQKVVFAGENTSGKDAPSAVYIGVSNQKTAEVSIQTCTIEKSEMNDASQPDKPTVLALVGAGTGKLTMDNCTILPTVVGGVRMDAGLDAGNGTDLSVQNLIVRDCLIRIAPTGAYASTFAIDYLLMADAATVNGECTITGNEIDSRGTSSPNGFQHGILFGGEAKNGGTVFMSHSVTHITDNLIAGCRGVGLSTLAKWDGTGSGEARIECWDIARNEIRDNGDAGILVDYGDNTHAVYIDYHLNSNLIVKNYHGMHFKNGNAGFNGHVEMLNDTIAGNTNLGLKVDTTSTSSAPIRIIENTILWFNNGGQGHAQWGGAANWDPDANTQYFRYNDWDGYTSSADGNIDDDPLFIDWTNGNFHLDGVSPGVSPCIDKGTNSPVQGEQLSDTDYEGDRRKIDGDGDQVQTVDMGADEYKP